MNTTLLHADSKAGRYVRERMERGLVVVWATRPIIGHYETERLSLHDDGGNYGFVVSAEPTYPDYYALMSGWERDDARILNTYTNAETEKMIETLVALDEVGENKGYSLVYYREMLGDDTMRLLAEQYDLPYRVTKE